MSGRQPTWPIGFRQGDAVRPSEAALAAGALRSHQTHIGYVGRAWWDRHGTPRVSVLWPERTTLQAYPVSYLEAASDGDVLSARLAPREGDQPATAPAPLQVWVVTTETNGSRNGEADLSIEAIYRAEQDALDAVEVLKEASRAAGEIVDGDDEDEPDEWTISHQAALHNVVDLSGGRKS